MWALEFVQLWLKDLHLTSNTLSLRVNNGTGVTWESGGVPMLPLSSQRAFVLQESSS